MAFLSPAFRILHVFSMPIENEVGRKRLGACISENFILRPMDFSQSHLLFRSYAQKRRVEKSTFLSC